MSKIDGGGFGNYVKYISLLRPPMVAVEALHSSRYYWRWTNCPCIQGSVIFLHILLLFSNCSQDCFWSKSHLLCQSVRFKGERLNKTKRMHLRLFLPMGNSSGNFQNLFICPYFCCDYYWRALITYRKR
jgi:hypothetical protein